MSPKGAARQLPLAKNPDSHLPTPLAKNICQTRFGLLPPNPTCQKYGFTETLASGASPKHDHSRACPTEALLAPQWGILGLSWGPSWGQLACPSRGRHGGHQRANLGSRLGVILGPTWGPIWGRLGGHLGANLGSHLGANLGAHLKPSWGSSWGPSWEPSLGQLGGPSWGHLGNHLGANLGPHLKAVLGAILEPIWAHL